ncbi:uncharacterized protein LACBIDRAFT_334284 [Laccaria bicolor S238N-H82]|uniref:Predicted protein n=1 Tax=Laccaria bicolor (strain S238N-H82 / ATCC MYA-4686) TaxID=486041 RepID=B0DYQ9_LACBS|nr:uncharacterized protein LACBIDRAFT_334284 [Laccaria bicolor S238N-H82]EDR00332.1 predicted protein [Laccaria bicolor S238N-H82]|eukprot:XP_001889084.1 predicted protein [Laccaria bicolor S238N-H82]
MPLCLHQLQDFFYPSNEPAEWQDVTYRLRHLSLSTCAPLPSMTPGLLPTTYTKVRSGRMSSVDSASPSSSCAFVQRICCAPFAFPTIEVFVLRSFVTEGTLMPSIFLIIVRFVGAYLSAIPIVRICFFSILTVLRNLSTSMPFSS